MSVKISPSQKLVMTWAKARAAKETSEPVPAIINKEKTI